MKKFLVKIGILALIVAAITLIVNAIYVKNNKKDTGDINKFKTMPSNIGICNFGSSHGTRDYNYDEIDSEYTCFNFALTAQTLSYDYKLFEKYKDSISEGATVFINISYFSLYGQDEKYWDGFDSKNKRYYSLLPKSEIKDYNIKTALFVKYLPSLSSSTSNLVKSLLGMSKESEDTTWSRVAGQIDVKKDALEAYERHFVMIARKNDPNADIEINEDELEALYSFIDACKDKKVTPVLITPPLLREYTDIVKEKSPEFLDSFNAFMKEISTKTGTKYYNYDQDSRFIDNYNLFINSDHLNEEGARQFVNILMEEVINKTTN